VAAYFDVRHIELLLDAPLDFSRASSLHCASSIEATMDAVAGACQVRSCTCFTSTKVRILTYEALRAMDAVAGACQVRSLIALLVQKYEF
jgi:hypothetical protein